MNIEPEGLIAWTEEMTGLLEGAARPGCGSWGYYLHLPGGDYVEALAAERILNEQNPFAANPMEIWMAAVNGADAAEILANIDDPAWISKKAKEAVERDSSEYFVTDVQPDSFDRAWHDNRIRKDPYPWIYCDMAESEVESLGRALGSAELARKVASTAEYIRDCSEEMCEVAHESVGSEWGWNYTLDAGWVSEADFDRVTGGGPDADLYLLWENGELGIDAIQMGMEDPDALGQMTGDVVCEGIAFGTDVEPGDLSLSSMIELCAERPEMAREFEIGQVRDDANKRWNQEMHRPMDNQIDYAAGFEGRSINKLALPWYRDPRPDTKLVPLDAVLLDFHLQVRAAYFPADMPTDPGAYRYLARQAVSAVGDVRVCGQDVYELAGDLVEAISGDGGEIEPGHLDEILSRFKGLVGRPVDADMVNEYLEGIDGDRIVAFSCAGSMPGAPGPISTLPDKPAIRAYAYLGDIVIETDAFSQDAIRVRAEGDIGGLPESKWDRLDIWSRADALAPKMGLVRSHGADMEKPEEPGHHRKR